MTGGSRKLKAIKQISRRGQSGTTLIEIMIAVVVFSMGLAGTAALVVHNVKTTASASTRSQAVILADQLAESMRANLVAYETANFSSDPAATATVCRGSTKCTAVVQAQYDVTEWKAEVARLLPGGQAFICTDSDPIDDGKPGALACEGVGINVIKIFWTNARFNKEQQIADSDIRRLVTPVIP